MASPLRRRDHGVATDDNSAVHVTFLALFEWSDIDDDKNCKWALPSCVMLSNQLADECEMSLPGLGSRSIAFLQG